MDKYRAIKNEIHNYKGIVFDLDETLVDLRVDWNDLKRELTELVRLQTGEEIEFTPLDQKVNEVKSRYGKDMFQNLLQVIARYELLEEKYILNRDLIDIYENLDKNQKIAIYSMNTSQCVSNFVRKYLKKRPDILITKDDCVEPKPSGKDLKRLLKKWLLAEDQVLYIGNSEKDRVSGELAGVKTEIISIA